MSYTLALLTVMLSNSFLLNRTKQTTGSDYSLHLPSSPSGVIQARGSEPFQAHHTFLKLEIFEEYTLIFSKKPLDAKNCHCSNDMLQVSFYYSDPKSPISC